MLSYTTIQCILCSLWSEFLTTDCTERTEWGNWGLEKDREANTEPQNHSVYSVLSVVRVFSHGLHGLEEGMTKNLGRVCGQWKAHLEAEFLRLDPGT